MTSNGTFSKKRLVINAIIAGEGAQRTFDGFATHVSIDKTACPAMPRAKISIKGLSVDTMAAMTRLGYEAFTKAKNLISVYAGEGDSLSLAFKGEMATAWANFNAAPNVEFLIDAISGSYPNLIPESPLSIQGQQKVSDTIETLCKQIGYNFENNGVTASISNCTINGDPINKIKTITEMVGANMIIDNDTIVVLPNGGVRNTNGIPNITAENGMIGYPAFTERGISLKCFYRPDIQIGGQISVSSVVPRASGQWIVIGLKHELAANDPSQSVWKTEIQAIFPQFGV